MMRSVPPELATIASRVVWNEPVEYTLAHPDLFLQQVMTYGTADDVVTVKRYFPQQAFLEALRHTPPGQMDARSWMYWHRMFGMEPVPPLPHRAFL